MKKLTFMQKATIENAALRNGATDEQIEEKLRLATEKLNAPKMLPRSLCNRSTLIVIPS